MSRQPIEIRRLSWWTVTAACALALSACGGGGGGGGDTPPAATGDTGNTGGNNNNPSATVIRSLTQQAVANGNYAVDASSAGTVQITLPANANINVGDKVTVAGVSNNDWAIKLNDGQFINTSNLGGNVAPGTTWAAAGPADRWWFAEASANGDTLVAVSNLPVGGGLGVITISHDRGQTWTTTTPAGLPGPGAIWTSVDVSANGNTMIASTSDSVFVSTDGGANWTQATGFTGPGLILDVAIAANGSSMAVAQKGGFLYTSTNGTTFTPHSTAHQWEAVSLSDNGGTLMAVESSNGAGTGRIYRSTNGGTTLTPVGNPGEWYRADISGDGNTLVAAEVLGVAQISRDGGTTWSLLFPATGTASFGEVSVSTNGSVIAIATLGAGGQVQLSTDGGTTFAPSGPTGNFRAVTVSGDGSTLLSADNAAGGRLNVTRGNRTTVGTAGSVTGGQGKALVLEYQGNGAFKVNSSTGDFVIQ